ncbi:hypothetical protein Ptr902_01422 [Pyrenophora tritici-repentis]|nr:hypothetical protein Ptr902_01422 [Pyrenophora tritici-repentis]
MASASANLARLRKLLGEDGASTLTHAPLNRVVTAHQSYEPQAIPFMLLFGTVHDKSTGRPGQIWVLFYPPAEDDGAAAVEFHSYDAISDTSFRFDKQNICSVTTEVAPAFKTPKRSSKAKYEALAKYYFLEKLASMECQEGGTVELQVDIRIGQSLLDALKSVCIKFKKHAESQIPVRESRSMSATLLSDPDGVARPMSASPELGKPFVLLPPRIASRARDEIDHTDKVNALADLRTKEAEIDVATEDIEKEMETLQESRPKINEELQQLERELGIKREHKMEIAAQREDFFKDMSLAEAFELGREVERNRHKKRQRLS